MRLQLEVLTSYSYKREIRELSQVFQKLTHYLGSTTFTSLAHEYLNAQNKASETSFAMACKFRQFLKWHVIYSQTPNLLELARFDWLTFLAQNQFQLMQSFYSVDEPHSNRKFHIKNKSFIYIAIYKSGDRTITTRLSKNEYQILNWLKQGESIESIKRNVTLLEWPAKQIILALNHLKKLKITTISDDLEAQICVY